jgi:hypothetical protein
VAESLGDTSTITATSWAMALCDTTLDGYQQMS